MGQLIRLLLAVTALSFAMCAPADQTPSPEGDAGVQTDESHDYAAQASELGLCSPIGTNLPMPAYWTASFPFVDAMKPSFRFISGSPTAWQDDRPLDLDERGWLRSLLPDQTARAFIVDTNDVPGRPTGRFTVLYEGRGTMEYRGNVQNLERTPGRDTFDLDGGFYIDITQVDPSDPIRNIRVLLPGGSCEGDKYAHCERDADCGGSRCVPFEETHDAQPFHPEFLEEVRPFRALRFMDWMETNREAAQDYAPHQRSARHYEDYPIRADKSWRPVPVDVMIDLANELGTDAWFNIPHAADDDLVRRMAARVAERLRPDLKVYIEYTNEAWNTIFQQHHWINAQGCREESPDPHAECDGNGNGELCEYGDWGVHGRCVRYGERWFARRTAEVGQMWREAFGADGADRVVRVLGVQVGGNWWFERVLREELPNGDPVHQHVDAIATAPYFFARGDVDDLDDVFARNGTPDRPGAHWVLMGDPHDDNDSAVDWMLRDMAVLDDPDLRHLDLVAYEAGQGLFSMDRGQADMFLEANRNPRMKEVYRQYLGLWTLITRGSLMMHFSSATSAGWYGTWGHKEYQGQPRSEAPKYDQLLNYIEATRGCRDPRMR
jgi:hypothetical protein